MVECRYKNKWRTFVNDINNGADVRSDVKPLNTQEFERIVLIVRSDNNLKTQCRVQSKKKLLTCCSNESVKYMFLLFVISPARKKNYQKKIISIDIYVNLYKIYNIYYM